MKRWPSILLIFGTPMLGLVVGFQLFLAEIQQQPPARVEHAQGMVVLTGGADRVGDAIELFSRGYADRLLITGVNQAITKNEIIRLNPRSRDLIECCVDLGYEAVNTLGNAREARVWVEQNAIAKSLIVVTSNYHMPRAMAELLVALTSCGSRAGNRISEIFNRARTPDDSGLASLMPRLRSGQIRATAIGSSPLGLKATEMILLIRSLVFNSLFYVNLIALMVIGLPALAMPRRYVFIIARLWARSSLWLLRTVCGTHVEFRGRQHIPAAPFIIAAKHQSIWETFALTLLFDDFCYILKRELTYIPLFGWYLWKSGQIAIDRKSGSSALAQAAERARDIFAEKRVLFIFPEGTRRPAGASPKYKFGVAHIYAESRVQCLPVALNSGVFWARRSWLRRPGTIVVDILEPIAPGLDKDVFFNLLQDTMENASDQLVAEALANDPGLSPLIQRNRQIA